MNQAPQPYRALERSAFQGSIHGAQVDLFTLRNASGAFVKVCNYGARIVQIVMPNASGVLGDVALGFNDLAGLQRPSPTGVPSMGAFIGRYANRIAHARFSMDGIIYELSKNSGEHCIHGGASGTRYAVFSVVEHLSNRITLQHRFTQSTDGFPGDLDLLLTYALDDNNALNVSWQAQAGRVDTLGNFTSHVFFNLGCSTQSSIVNHSLQINASRYLPLNHALIPTGDLAEVGNTPFDFRSPQLIRDQISREHPQLALCGGYDHHFAVDDWDHKLKTVATLTEPTRGRRMTVHSTEPGVQLFTANGLSAAQCGFTPRSGVCLEPSYFPDSPNQPQFPSTRIAAGQSRSGEIVYAFGLLE